jgi:hypothetical protein
MDRLILIVDILGSVLPSKIHKEKSNKMQTMYQNTVPDNVHKRHVQQPSTYKKPEAASPDLGF